MPIKLPDNWGIFGHYMEKIYSKLITIMSIKIIIIFHLEFQIILFLPWRFWFLHLFNLSVCQFLHFKISAFHVIDHYIFILQIHPFYNMNFAIYQFLNHTFQSFFIHSNLNSCVLFYCWNLRWITIMLYLEILSPSKSKNLMFFLLKQFLQF